MKSAATYLRLPLVFAAVLLSLWVGVAPREAVAADRVADMIDRLKNHTDFRVRTQAALALGASGEARAVDPLCGGLTDSNTTVRAAAAAAIGKLGIGGVECLKSRLAAERVESVKSVIKTALGRLEGDRPSIGPSTRYYVAIAETTNKTSRSNRELDRVVRTALIKAMGEHGEFAWAPPGESTVAAQAVIDKNKRVRPFFIWPKVTATYSGGSLTLDFSLSMFTYPGKALVGTTSKKLTIPGVSSTSISDEDELIGMAADRLVPTVARTADGI